MAQLREMTLKAREGGFILHAVLGPEHFDLYTSVGEKLNFPLFCRHRNLHSD